jgi:hypothetical protein
VEQEQPDSPHINPAFIVFREKLNRMEKAGEFLEPIGPLVYAIQERQVNEIRVQVQRHNMALAPRVVEVFSRPDLLSPEDFRFFLGALKPPEFWLLLTGLAYESSSWLDKDGAWLKPSHPGVGDLIFLKQFLREHGSHLDVHGDEENQGVRSDHLQNGFMTGKLFNLVAAVFEPVEAKAIYHSLEGVLSPDKVKANRFGVELNLLARLPMAVDAADGEHAFLGFKMHPGNDSPVVKAWLQRYALFKSISDTPDDLPSRIKNRFTHYDEGLPKDRKGYHVPVIRKVMGESLLSCAEQLIETLGQKSSVALQCFGVPTQKASAAQIPKEMFNLIVNVQSSALDPTVQKKLIGQVFITLLNGRGEKMQSDSVKNVLAAAKNSIDWEYCVSKLNAKGRDQLIKEFDDSSYFNKYLGNKDLGKSFSRDLGL